ncbi:hypothetical protein GOODEAATRI_024555 [Goodea atripinnis]|uniref:Uncharacterized protein n=1 Tax=Goodea atripinnis TaxID=208336 RepID=A0ABV0Q0R7_9TELE
MKVAEGFLKLPAYTGSEETVFSPDFSGMFDIGPYHPPSPYIFYSTSSLFSSLRAQSPSEFLELSTSDEEIKEEGEGVVNSNTGQADKVYAEPSGKSLLPHGLQEQDEVDGCMSPALIATV